jgi:hypothetical protein
MRGSYFGAIAAKVTEAKVISDNNEEIGSSILLAAHCNLLTPYEARYVGRLEEQQSAGKTL